MHYLTKMHGMNNVKFSVWLLIKSFATKPKPSTSWASNWPFSEYVHSTY